MSKICRAETLDIAYDEYGPEDGSVVIMLHGFPDDAKTWAASATALAENGFRVLTPYQRGFGETRFHDDEEPRAGQYGALAQDVIDFANALQIDRFLLAGHDWGASAAYFVACLWPDRVTGLVAMSVGYTGGQEQKLSIEQKQAYWYQWLFNFKEGEETLWQDRTAFCRYLWQIWSPDWKFDAATLAATARSWTNSDFVAVVTHSYRHRWKNAKGVYRYDVLTRQVQKQPRIAVPTILLHGERDGASLAASSEGKEKFFSGPYERRVLPGVGHFVQREAPDVVVEAVQALAGDVAESGQAPRAGRRFIVARALAAIRRGDLTAH